MNPDPFARSAILMFVLLNPFFMTVYLLDLIQTVSLGRFAKMLAAGAMLSSVVFVVFAWLGDAVFTDVLQVRFASFLIFGGVIFLLVGIRFFYAGTKSLEDLRGSPEPSAGSIAMPFMIGPGTISASVLAGSYLPVSSASLAIVSAVVASTLTVIMLKYVYDLIYDRYALLISRYIDITGRVMALVTGTIAVEMMLRGVELWLEQLE